MTLLDQITDTDMSQFNIAVQQTAHTQKHLTFVLSLFLSVTPQQFEHRRRNQSEGVLTCFAKCSMHERLRSFHLSLITFDKKHFLLFTCL